jgi:ComF family protein
MRQARVVSDSFFALFFPTVCHLCDRPIEGFTLVPVCAACLSSIRPYSGMECGKCGMFLDAPAGSPPMGVCELCRKEEFAFHGARSYAWYEGNLRSAVQLLKYRAFRPLARPLGKHLMEAMGKLQPAAFDLIVPVPLHRNRERLRGFNQSALLAAKLSRLSGVPLGAASCIRVRDTPPQTGLGAAERRKNVAEAFHVPHPQWVSSRRLLLVDDVLTTGATVNACANALLKAGAKSVCVVTLARVRQRDVDVL